MLLQQKWRGRANLRTLHGYVPYYGGGIAFKFPNLLFRGVKPSWYLKGDYSVAIHQLVEAGYFDSTLDAERHYSHYPNECEWFGPKGMRFDLNDIQYIWLGGQVGHPYSADSILEMLNEILPDDILIRLEHPESLGADNPCKD